MNLVVVESPTKAKTIGQYLGKEYVVKTSMGHIRDLPTYSLGVDIEKDFDPSYVIVKGRKELVDELKKLAQESSLFYIATDEDREGESIGWHIIQATGVDPAKVKRVAFHEITKEAIDRAFDNPRELDFNLIEAQQARRILDRIVGYKLSPLLWKKLSSNLSAGRVQSAALKIVVDREKEIDQFKPAKYYSMTLDHSLGQKTLKSVLISIEGRKLKEQELKERQLLEEIEKKIFPGEVSVEDIKKSEKADTPSPPFITSSLQQEAIKKYGFSAQRVMQIAQHLYEGVETPGGILGLITYHRTDSVNVAEQAQKKARVYIKETFGDGALPPKSPQYKTKSRLAQEAHEAIRPTDVFNAPEKVQEYLKPDELKVYQLIWMRFLSSQMKKGVWEHLSVVLKTREYLFQLKARRIGEKGYLVLYPEKLNEEENNYEILKSLSKGSRLPIEKVTINSHETKPPARYTEASLIKEMEELGIGRPSTFAPTVGILFKRGYVRKERGSLFPQELGKRVKDMLEEYFHPILDLKFTARLEEDLDLIAQGQKKRLDILKDFYSWFSRELIEAQKKITSQKQQSTDEKCPGCGASLFMGFNRFGKYLYCKNCRKKILFDKNGVKVEGEIKECALCHSPMRLVLGRRGFFYSCTAFPRCRYTESYKK